MTTALRWGILGVGDVCERKSGPLAFNQDGSSAVVAVMRRDAAKAEEFASRHKVPRWYSDAELLVADAEIDAIYVASPPSSHLSLAALAAAAGKPTIVEKPIARSYRESAELVAAFEAANVPVFVAYYRRAYPRIQRLRELCRAGAALAHIEYRHTRPAKPNGGWRVSVTTSGGGHFVDVGSHVLDMLDFCFGPLCNVQPAELRGPAGGAEEYVSATFTTAAGAAGTAVWDFDASSDEDSLHVHKADGSFIRVPGLMNGDTIEVHASPTSGATETFTDAPPAVVHRPFVTSAVDAIRTGDTSACASTASSALRTSYVCIYTCLYLYLYLYLFLYIYLRCAAHRCGHRRHPRTLLWRQGGRLLGAAGHVAVQVILPLPLSLPLPLTLG